MKRQLAILLAGIMLVTSFQVPVIAEEKNEMNENGIGDERFDSENAFDEQELLDEVIFEEKQIPEEETFGGEYELKSDDIGIEIIPSLDEKNIEISNVSMSDADYNAKMNAFISDSRWRAGAAYYNGMPGIPYVSNNGSREAYKDPSGCYAYAQDFIKYVYGIDDNYTSGERFTNVAEIRTGDVIHMSPEHTFVVLRRDGNTLYTADGGRNENKPPYTSNNVKVGNTEYTVNRQVCSWGYFIEGYHFLNLTGSSTSMSCSISPTLAKSSMNIGDMCKVGGNVSSTGASISKVSAGIYTDKSGNNCVNGIYKENSVNSYYYSLSRIDNDIHFERITSGGTFYLVVKATLSNGKVYSNCVGFTVNGNTCSSPEVSFADINGGKQVKITKSSSDTINYTIKKNGVAISNGSSASNPFTANLTEEGEYSVSAYASRGGYTNSGSVSKSTKVTKVAPPEIVQSMTESGIAITMNSGTSGATIYYTTNGSNPTTNSNKFTGSLVFTETKIVKAIASRSGYINSDVSESDVNLAEPDSPSNVKLISPEKIPVGDALTITWDGNMMASSYTAELYKGATKVDEYTTTGKTASFVLNDAGIYSVKVYASNFVGNSFASEEDITVEAMAPCTIRFLNWDGKVINSQKVVYGQDAVIPDSPERRGYTFISWDKENMLKGVKEDIDATAIYKINTYAVRFFNASGKQVGSAQKVEYMNSATAPVDSLTDMPTGYTLAGWRVIESSSDSAGDYTKVDSDMKLQAVYCWENEELPIVANITSAKFDADTSNYKVDVDLTNYPTAATTAILRVSLKTAAGKMVKSTKQEVDILPDATVSKSVTLKYSGKASYVSVVLLGLEGDDLTGSAYSKEVTKPISYLTDTTWTDWSEWSATPASSSASKEVEKVIEYRYKDKQTTTGGSNTMAGWTLYDTKSNWSSWGAWSGWSPVAQSGNDSKQVESRTEWRYYCFLCPVCGGREPYQGTSDCHRYTLTGGNWNELWCGVPYNSVPSSTFSYTSAKRYTTAIDGRIWIFGSSNINDSAPGTRDGGVGDPIIRTAYRYRTRFKVNTYYFYKWGDWSNWDTTEYIANDNRQVETRTLYRYRDKVEITDDRAEKNEEEGITHTISGTLPISVDLNGKLATVMVYKGKNTDPNEDQIQYVGQTEFGAGNTYSFDVIPKTEPNLLTGDFTVCLGIEGSTGLINVGIIAASQRDYKVNFYDMDDTLISSQDVSAGNNAIVPASPSKDGYIFVGWSMNATNVQEDLTITAVYAPLTYTVAFVDSANGVVSFDYYKYGEKIVPPENPHADGKVFKGWDCVLNDDQYVHNNRVVSAVYDTTQFEVKFVDEKGDIVKKEYVDYGKSANPPVGIVAEGKTFHSWSTAEEWWCVTKNITVSPILRYAETVSEPSYEIIRGDHSAVVYLETETEGADIYYKMKNDEGEVENYKYGGPVVIENLKCELNESGEDLICTYKADLQAYAICEGMNDSDVIDIAYQDDEIIDPSSNSQVTLWFDGNGADYIDYGTKLISYGEQYGKFPNTEREGFYFAGWYNDEMNGTKVYPSDAFNAGDSLVLYAHWSTTPVDNDDNKKDISKAKISDIPAQIYTRIPTEPEFSVSLDGKTLIKDQDYTYKFVDNNKVGIAKIVVTGNEDYSGIVEKTFEIEESLNNSYEITLATKEKYEIKEIAKTETDGKNYKVGYNKSGNKADSQYALFNSKGLITAKKEGVANIIVNKGDVEYKIIVKVVNPKFIYDNSKQKNFTVNTGETIIAAYEDCKLKTEFSIDNKSIKNGIATIDSETGRLTAIKKGVVTITATVGGEQNKKYARKVTTKVRIYDPTFEDFKIGKQGVINQLPIGKSLPLKVKNGFGATTWSVSDNSIATIDNKNRLKAVGFGTTTVTAINNGRVIKKEIVVPLPEITSTRDAVAANSTLVLKLKNDMTAQKTVWSVSDDKIATITQGGVLKGISPGVVTVTAENSGVKIQKEIVVF